MKKIVNPTGFARLEGFAEKNGVTIRPYLGFFPIFSVGPTIRATVDENGLTSCKVVEEESEFNQLEDKIAKLKKRALVACSIAAVLMFVLTLVFALVEGVMYQVTFTLLYFCIAGILMSESVGIFFARLFKDEEIRNYSKYLGAKNAIINAFNATDRVPNQEEIREYSTWSGEPKYHRDCYLATVFIAFSVLRFLPLPWYILSAIILVGALISLEKKRILSFWQVLTVSKPDDVHYHAAIEALREAIKFYDEMHFSLVVSVETEADPKQLELALENCKKCADYDSCEEREKREQLLKELLKAAEDEAADAAASDDPAEEDGDETHVKEVAKPEDKQPDAGSNPTDTNEVEGQDTAQ